jgi:hypothetical protein
MPFDELQESGWRIASERRLGKMPIIRNKILWASVQIGEIATATAGNQNFLADAIGAFEYQDAPFSLASLNRAPQASSARSKNDNVVSLIHAAVFLVYSKRFQGKMGFVWEPQ